MSSSRSPEARAQSWRAAAADPRGRHGRATSAPETWHEPEPGRTRLESAASRLAGGRSLGAYLDWALRAVVALILLQTLFFKFTGAEESVYIFSTLGLEPWGRIGTGMAELAAALLVLLPATVPYGAALALLLMGGAIMSHLTKLGIVVMDDGGLLFGLAVSVAAVSAALVWIHRHRLPLVGDRA